MRTLVAGLLTTLALAPAADAAAPSLNWTAPRAAGAAEQLVVARGVGSRVAGAIVTVRRRGPHGALIALRRVNRSGPGRAIVLARTPGSVFEPAVDVRPGGDATVAWDAAVAGAGSRGNIRTFAVRLPQGASGRGVSPLSLTGAGESSYAPAFVPGVAGPLLAWERRTGPLQFARWDRSGGPPAVGRLDFAARGVSFQTALAGTRTGRVVGVLVPRARLQLAISDDGARSFAPPVAVSTGTVLSYPPAVGLDTNGNAAVAWAERTAAGPARIMLAQLPKGARAPGAPVQVDAPATAPSDPVLAPAELGIGGASVGWVVTRRGRDTARNSPGRVLVRTYDAAGSPLGPVARLGGPGETGRDLRLVRGGHGVIALWTTRSGALRAQDVELDGTPHRAETLARGVRAGSLRVTPNASLVAFLAGGRAYVIARRRP